MGKSEMGTNINNKGGYGWATKKNLQAKEINVILSVILIGLMFLCGCLTYIYYEELKKDSCKLCFSFNPRLSDCENRTEINLSNIKITSPIISYGK